MCATIWSAFWRVDCTFFIALRSCALRRARRFAIACTFISAACGRGNELTCGLSG